MPTWSNRPCAHGCGRCQQLGPCHEHAHAGLPGQAECSRSCPVMPIQTGCEQVQRAVMLWAVMRLRKAKRSPEKKIPYHNISAETR
jgi:hypothetical protein